MGIVWLFEPVLRSLDIQASVLNQAIPYLRALNWGTLPLLLYFVFRRYLQGMNLAKPVMFALIIGEPGKSRGELGARVWASWISRDGNGGIGMVHVRRANLYDERLAGVRRVLRSSLPDGTARHSAASELSSHVAACAIGTSGRDAIWNGSRSVRGLHGADWQDWARWRWRAIRWR